MLIPTRSEERRVGKECRSLCDWSSDVCSSDLFRDFTRIAASSPEMWRDVCIANRAALLTEIDAYTNVLARFRQAIDTADGAALETAFERSRTARTEWQQGG